MNWFTYLRKTMVIPLMVAVVLFSVVGCSASEGVSRDSTPSSRDTTIVVGEQDSGIGFFKTAALVAGIGLTAAGIVYVAKTLSAASKASGEINNGKRLPDF